MDAAWINLLGIVVTGIFGVLTALVTTIGVVKKANAERRTEEALREQRQELKFQEIEKKLDEHNGYAQKFGEVHDELIKQGADISWIMQEMKNGKK